MSVNPMVQYLQRAVKHFEDTGELYNGSTSEQLMIAFALARWDLISSINNQFVDPLNAWFYRLNKQQREAVLEHRPELAEFLRTHKDN
jgi:hypothetical protein